MRSRTIQTIFVLSLSFFRAEGQSGSAPLTKPSVPNVPSYSISFQKGDAVPGIGAVPVMQLPFECTDDGTVFITTVQPLVGAVPQTAAQISSSLLLISIARDKEAHSFPLTKVPDLYAIEEIGDYVTDSKVVFLVRAATSQSDPPEKAEHHVYIAIFDRDGNYEKKVQVEDNFQIHKIGLFPSGTYLAYGSDKQDHSPKLAMLKDDGTLLKYLEVPKKDIPEAAVGTLDGKGKGPAAYIAPVQFMGQDHSIYVVQNKTDFPILEVSEAGAIREIHPKLPAGSQVRMLVASDNNLYAQVGEMADRTIYEIDSRSGDALKHLQVSENQPTASVACVNGDKFLSFRDIQGKLVPLIGTAEPKDSSPQ